MKKLTKVEIKTKLELHLKWVRGEEGGSRADLSGADLSEANLSRADLSWADLSRANLSWANLSWANLSGADLWITQWPLWCGTRKVKIDVKIAMQLAAHYCAVECDDPEYQETRKAILKFAQKSHVAKDLEII